MLRWIRRHLSKAIAEKQIIEQNNINNSQDNHDLQASDKLISLPATETNKPHLSRTALERILRLRCLFE
jgi:hypothetical protein